MRLDAGTLASLPPAVQRPSYDIDAQKAGIVHFGIGAFHRAHQAVYTDDAMNAGERDWAPATLAIHGGQATSYMIGRLEIQRMRREAEERQGDRFDVRKFHSAVLDSGGLPLDVLDAVVRTRLP